MLYYTTQYCTTLYFYEGGCCIPPLSRRRISHHHFTIVATQYHSLLHVYKSGGSMPISFNKEDLASPSHCTISHLQRWMWNCHLVEQGGVGIPTSQYYAILYYTILSYTIFSFAKVQVLSPSLSRGWIRHFPSH